MPYILPPREVSGTTAHDSTSSPRLIYAGVFLIVVALVGLATWIGVRTFRKRAQAKREDAQGAAFLSVRGLVKEEKIEKSDPPPEKLQVTLSPSLSQELLTSQIAVPEKAFTLPDSPTPKDIIEFHRQSGNFPRPFTFALNAASSTSPRSSLLNPNSAGKRASSGPSSPTFPRHSFGGSSHRFSVMSSCSVASSLQSQGHLRKVHQIFTPVLPDELLITRIGERLTVMQSFDDGWCVVGRENSAFKAPWAPKSLFGSNSEKEPQSDIELGVVPAWCFLKPVKGLRAERPVRSSSLGVTVQLDGPGISSRDEVISWSNF